MRYDTKNRLWNAFKALHIQDALTKPTLPASCYREHDALLKMAKPALVMQYAAQGAREKEHEDRDSSPKDGR